MIPECYSFAEKLSIENKTTIKIKTKILKIKIMKTRIVLISFIALVSVLTSCKKDKIQIIPTTNVTTVEKTIAVHNKLNVSHAFQVFLTFSETEESITVETNQNLHSYVQIQDKDGWLKIYLKDFVNIVSENRVLNIYITTKNINEYQIAGAAAVILESELYTDDLNLELSGAGSCTGTIYANNLYATLLGGSKMDVSGSANLLDLKAEGGGMFKNYSLEVAQLDADLNGGAKVYLSVTESLKVKASGGSQVFYKGDGVIESQELSGGSTINKMD